MFLEKRARKKKSLTDPVEIIPFEGQNKREAAAPAQNQKQPVQRISVPAIPEPKILKVPTGQLNTSNLSINEMYQKEKDKLKATAPENLPYEHFTSDQMIMLWKQYVFQMKELGKDTIYYAMNKRLPVLKDETKIFLEIDNVAQEGAMQRIHQELLDFLREGLKNYQVQLEVVLTQNTDNEISLTNPRDKYKSLAKQYPNLNSLRTAFNLDFES